MPSKTEKNRLKQQRKHQRKLQNQGASSSVSASAESAAAPAPKDVLTPQVEERLMRVPDRMLRQYKEEAARESKGGKKEKKRKSANNAIGNPGKKKKAVRKSLELHGHALLDKMLTDESSGRRTNDLSGAGERLFSWLIHPITLTQFFDEYYEKKPLLIQRGPKARDYYKGLISSEEIFRLSKEGKFKYNHDLDVTKYQNGKRDTLNAKENVVAKEDELREHFKDGCSVRLLRPQEHCDVVWRTVACLESFWKCGGGANSYLTPAGTQGFAPHYDDIEAFCVQLEGEKKWKVYSPYDGDDEELRKLFPLLPNVSSRDFTQEELEDLEIAHEVTLRPGDLLYLPRGVVHQARSVDEKHSLHLTLSSGQRNTVGDFLKRALPAALEEACHDANTDETARLLRAALPLDYTDYMGVMHSDLDEHAESQGAGRRRLFVEQMVRVVTEAVLEHMPFDITADEMSSAFQHDRHLPDVVRQQDESDSESDDDEDDEEDNDDEEEEEELDLTDFVKLAVRDSARLTVEGDAAIVYHSMKNTRVIHEVDARGLEFEVEDAPVIETLLTSGDNWVQVSELVDKSVEGHDQDCLRVVDVLLGECVLVRKKKKNKKN